jgi:D-threo-aldose 1-dehydrogenase
MTGSSGGRPLGTTGLTVSPLTLGGAPLGSMPENFGYEVAEDDAVAVVLAALNSDIRVIDTSNGYSDGRSEARIGRAISEHGGLPDDYLVMTKVDARDRDYSGDRIRASLAESEGRLGLPVPLPVVFLHDPEFFSFDDMTAPGGAVDALVRARDLGLVGRIGVAGGNVHELARYLELGVFDVLLTHNRWTLVDRSAGQLIEAATARGVGVVNAAVLGGGILAATARGSDPAYGYRPASAATLAAVQAMRGVCEDWGTDLASAAVRFSTRDPRIATTVVGMSRVDRLAPTIAASQLDLPEEFWAALEGLLPPETNWLDYRPDPPRKDS